MSNTPVLSFILHLVFSLKEYYSFLISVPSVGQPRDENPQAGYMIYDSRSGLVEIRRVDYDIAVTQREILAAGLPKKYALRLERGQ